MSAGAALGAEYLAVFLLWFVIASGIAAIVFLGLEKRLVTVADKVARVVLLGDIKEVNSGVNNPTTTMPMAVPILIGGVVSLWLYLT
jgi:hypothetical protein